jgi:hypothetical protein
MLLELDFFLLFPANSIFLMGYNILLRSKVLIALCTFESLSAHIGYVPGEIVKQDATLTFDLLLIRFHPSDGIRIWHDEWTWAGLGKVRSSLVRVTATIVEKERVKHLRRLFRMKVMKRSLQRYRELPGVRDYVLSGCGCGSVSTG